MDATNEARPSLGASTGRRSFADVITALAIAFVLLAALSVWRVTAAPEPAAPVSRDTVGSTGATNLSIIGDHRSEGLPGVVPAPGRSQGPSSTGPHPPQKDPKRG